MFYSLRKSWKLRRISKILDRPVTDLTGELLQSRPTAKDRDLEALLDLCQRDPAVVAVMNEFGVHREDLKNIYSELVANFARQWAGLHWVAASALAYGTTLKFYLENARSKSPGERVSLLIEYFERDETGPVNLGCRGPVGRRVPR